MSEWLDRLSGAGAGILLMHGEHYNDLQLLAERAGKGLDGLTHDMIEYPGPRRHQGAGLSPRRRCVMAWRTVLAVGNFYLVLMCQADYPEMCDSRLGHP